MSSIQLSAYELASDPLLAAQAFPYLETFYPLGFPVEIETNSFEVVAAARESWSEQAPLLPSQPALKLRLGLTPTDVHDCPPAPVFRAHDHLLTIVADAENFVTCDLERGTAFGWVNQAALRHRTYLRYHLLEAAVLCLLAGSRVTPIHAACISLNGRGLLLCGDSGAGKSTLAYACARAGFTLTTDDASYVVWQASATPHVRGNAHQIRFRPSARTLFPELAHRALTPRAEGKPSIEVRTAELEILTNTETVVHSIFLLNRDPENRVAQLLPLPSAHVLPYLHATLLPLRGIYERQAEALTSLRALPVYSFHFGDLPSAIACLTRFTETGTIGDNPMTI